jgi:hypothetical protein
MAAFVIGPLLAGLLAAAGCYRPIYLGTDR